MFDIQLEAQRVRHEGAEFWRGIITLGEHRESFLAAAGLWPRTRYEQQWRAAATTLARGAARSAFITSFIHPDAHHNVIWPAWRDGNDVYIQNRLLLRPQLATVVDPERIEDFIGERRVTNDEGEPISEWKISIGELASFAA